MDKDILDDELRSRIAALVCSAKDFSEKQELEKAENLYGEALRLCPDCVDAWIGYASCAEKRKDLPEASKRWLEARTRVPSAEFLHQKAASALAVHGQLAAAERCYLDALARFPDSETLWSGLATVQQRQSKLTSAYDTWGELLQRNPSHEQARIDRCRILLRLGRIHEAEVLLESACGEGHRAAGELLIQSARENGRLERALVLAQEFSRAFPDFPGIEHEHVKVLLDLNRFSDAERLLEALLGRFSDQPSVWTTWARSAVRRRNHHEALQRWIKVCDVFPDCVDAWRGRFQSMLEAHRYDEALELAYDLELTRKDPEFSVLRCQLLKFGWNWSEAFTLARELTLEHSDNPKIAIVESQVMLDYRRTSTVRAAIELLEQVHLRCPDDLHVTINRIRALIAGGRDREARTAIAALPPELHQRWITELRVWAAQQQGEVADACRMWRQYIAPSEFPALSAEIQCWERRDRRPLFVGPEEVVLFALVRDRRPWLPWFLDYYRKLGVNRFVFVDNDSSDGSGDYLLEHPDAHVFWTADHFGDSGSGMRWINKLIDDHASSNWCLYVDLDEMLVFPGSEFGGLRPLLRYAKSKDQTVVRSFMLDMYPEHLHESSTTDVAANPLAAASYFHREYTFTGQSLCPYVHASGGILQEWFDDRGRLTKVPILNAAGGVRFISSHETTPARVCDVTSTLLHFKLHAELPQFSARQVSEGKRFYVVSQRYRHYENVLRRLPADISLVGPRSERYSSSRDLVKLGLLEEPAEYTARLQIPQRSLRIGLKTAVPSIEKSETWGDYHFARSLARELSNLGHLVRVDLLPDHHCQEGEDDDVVIVLRGLAEYKIDKTKINLIWLISHPEIVEQAELASYDHVFIASAPYADSLRAAGLSSAEALLQCVDPALFFPDPEPSSNQRILFVGNSRGVYRESLKAAIEQGLSPELYGSGWGSDMPSSILRGTHIRNVELQRHYTQCGVLLNDHWKDMRDMGFLNNRLFDAAASATPVVTDHVRGIQSVFGDVMTTYDNPAQLTDKVREVLATAIERRPERLRLAAHVRSEHSFARRAERILSVIGHILEQRRT